MPTIKIEDQLSHRSPAAAALVQRISQALQGLVTNVDFDCENRIPTVVAWQSGENAVLDVTTVARVGEQLLAVTQQPVHFYELRGDQVTFFVFAPDLLYPDEAFKPSHYEEYGHPVAAWLRAFTKTS